MYRQDLSSIIRPLGALLFLFIVFQIWIKPTYLHQSPPEPPEPLASQPSTDKHTFPLAQDPPHAALQARLIQVGEAPSAMLGNIRDDLDRGNYRDAEANLHKLPNKLLANEDAKRFAAALWNNLGVRQEASSGIEVSVRAFQQAVALAPKNPVALLNLTHAYWGLHDKALTPAFLESVLHAAPNDAFAHIALADVQIEHGNLAEAARHLKHARARAVADPDLTAYIRRLSGKLDLRRGAEAGIPAATADQTPATVSGVSAPSTGTTDRPVLAHGPESFVITFDGKPDPETALRIRSILNYAYEDMTKKFGSTPSASLQVVLHTGRTFSLDAGNPGGADALYDQDSRSIHLPVDGAMEDLAVLSRILRHQLAHALIQTKMRTRKDFIPTWLVEGLAIHLADDPWPALDEIKQKPPAMISLALLEKGWDRTRRDTLDLAYLESATAAQNLIDRFGMYGIRQLMNLLQEGQSLNAAMQQKWSVSYDQFQRDWERSMTSSLGQQ